MITTVSLNPAIDRTILITGLKRGGVNRIMNAREDIGGKGINVAKILHRLDVPAQVIGFIGNKNKQSVFNLLSEEELPHYFLETQGLTRTNTKVVELDQQITTDFNEQGFSVQYELMEQFKTILINKAAQSDYMVFSGSIPKGLSETVYKELILSVRGQTRTVLDADGRLLFEGIKASPFMIKPNLHELEEAFGVKLASRADVTSFCRPLAKKYGISLILVSMGDKGSLLISENECYQAEPIRIDVKSTVGAGDSMIAGMLYGINRGLSVDKAFAYAAACGTLAVTKEGTQSFSIDEVLDMLKRVRINKL